MRNSEAQRYARWSAGAAFLLFLVVVGVYLRRVWVIHEVEKKAPPAVPATVEQRSAEFSFSKVGGQRTIFTIRASRATQFKEGSRNLLEDVSIIVHGQNGERNDMLRTRACDFISSTGGITCAGEVRMDLQAADAATPGNARVIQVTTSSVSFDRDSGMARTEKPVTFRWPSGEGRAIGAEYNANTGALRLDHSVELTLAPPPGPGQPAALSPRSSLHLEGGSMLFRRDSRTLQMLESVHAQQDTHELTAGSLLLELDANLHARHLVATDGPRLHETDRQGPVTVTADEFSASMNREGQVESVVAAGHVDGSRSTPAGEDQIQAGRVQLDFEPRPAAPRLLTAREGVILISRSTTAAGGTRRVETEALQMIFADDPKAKGVRLKSANTLAPAQIEWQNNTLAEGKPVHQTTRMRGQRMDLAFDSQNQLQQVLSSGGVEVVRQLGGVPEQVTTSRDLDARFIGGQWATIDQTGDVRFREGSRSAQGEHAHAERINDTATLTGSVVLADGSTRTTARSAVFTQGSNQIRADGGVLTTELRAGTRSFTNLAQQPGHISADHLVADSASRDAVYSGGGRLWQGDSVIEADTIALDSASQTIVAKGRVRGVFPEAAWNPNRRETAARPSPPKAELWRVQAGLLTYWGKESRARAEQGVVADSTQGSIQSKQMDLYFSDSETSSPAKQLDRAVATGHVTVQEADRRGTSDRAEYTAKDGKFILSEGKPTIYDSSGDTTTGRQLTFYFADDRIVVDSEEGTRTVTLHRVEK